MAYASLAEVQAQKVADFEDNVALGNPGLVIGTTTPSKIKITNAFTYRNTGQTYSSSAAATEYTIAQPTQAGTAYVQAAATTNYYLVTIDASNVVAVWAPPLILSTNPDTTQIALAAPQDGKTVIGICKVVTAGSTFTWGTTALTGVATFANLSYYPAREAPSFTYA